MKPLQTPSLETHLSKTPSQISTIGITSSGNTASVNGTNAPIVNSISGAVTDGNLKISVNGVESGDIPLPKTPASDIPTIDIINNGPNNNPLNAAGLLFSGKITFNGTLTSDSEEKSIYEYSADTVSITNPNSNINYIYGVSAYKFIETWNLFIFYKYGITKHTGYLPTEDVQIYDVQYVDEDGAQLERRMNIADGTYKIRMQRIRFYGVSQTSFPEIAIIYDTPKYIQFNVENGNLVMPNTFTISKEECIFLSRYYTDFANKLFTISMSTDYSTLEKIGD